MPASPQPPTPPSYRSPEPTRYRSGGDRIHAPPPSRAVAQPGITQPRPQSPLVSLGILHGGAPERALAAAATSGKRVFAGGEGGIVPLRACESFDFRSELYHI